MVNKMEAHIAQLTEQLLQMNPEMSANRARTWVELLWSDYEATDSKY